MREALKMRAQNARAFMSIQAVYKIIQMFFYNSNN